VEVFCCFYLNAQNRIIKRALFKVSAENFGSKEICTHTGRISSLGYPASRYLYILFSSYRLTLECVYIGKQRYILPLESFP
jgi:hypothetical protein